jgi:hypothetical protein
VEGDSEYHGYIKGEHTSNTGNEHNRNEDTIESIGKIEEIMATNLLKTTEQILVAGITPFDPQAFSPMFIFPFEYAKFGLPDMTKEPDIEGLVSTISSSIDVYCGRQDSDGNGSLVYSTYSQRIMSQAPGRNLALLPIKPMVALTDPAISTLQSLAMSGNWQTSVLGLSASGNYFYTGALASTNTLADGRTSSIIGASGRYTYQRRDTYPLQNDPMGIINPLNAITLFGGPPPWIAIDMVNLDYDEKTGEVWYAAGQWMERYTETVFVYSAGYDPTNIPITVKRACAAGVKNLLAKGCGTTGMKSFSMSGAGITAQFDPDMLDPNIKMMLQPYVAVRLY